MPIPEKVRAELAQLSEDLTTEVPEALDLLDGLEYDDASEVAVLLFAAAAARGSVSLHFTRDDGEIEVITAHAKKGEDGELLMIAAIDSPDNIHSPDIVEFAVELGLQSHLEEIEKYISE